MAKDMHLLQSSVVAFVAALASVSCWPGPLTSRIDNVPMYGQPGIVRPESLRELDSQFIQDAVAGLGTRERASDIWWAQAEEFFARGDFDFAMRRYNQSWLLNPANFKPYWGFARVLLENGKIDEAIRHFETAVGLVDDKHQEAALVTDFGNAYIDKARGEVSVEMRSAYFTKADNLYDRALIIDSDYGNAWKRYAMSMYYQGKYADAWAKIAEARKRPNTVIPSSFLRDLRNRVPEPQ